MNINLHSCETEQIDSIVKSIVTKIHDLLKNQNQVILAVSGGKSPIALFKKLSETKDIPWEKIVITLVDERVTDTNSEDSNENLVRTYLLKNFASSAKFIGLVKPEKTMQELIEASQDWINKIDIAILGMGGDGHTASIFPECQEFETAINKDAKPSYIETNPISAKYKRIGLNLNGIIQIKHLILSISGDLKLKIIKDSIKTINPNYPISYLLKARPDMQIFYFE